MPSQELCSRLFDTLCVSRLSYSDTGAFIFTLLAASTVSQIDSDMDKLDDTNIAYTLCKLKPNQILSLMKFDLCETFLKHTELYSNILTVQ